MDANEIRAIRRRFERDVTYEVWQRGGNVDAINSDRVWDSYADGYDSEEAAAIELRSQRRARQKEE